jgi:Plasmid pRiA4b ORF-3-like protein
LGSLLSAAYTGAMPRGFDVLVELSNVTPRVWRVLRVPADLRLDDLHHAIQTVMGWDDFHPHVFEVGDREYGPRTVHDESDEEDDELREPSAWAGEDHELTIADALRDSPAGITYVYDFDEDWRVRITRAAGLDADSVTDVACIDGEEAGPQQELAKFETFTVDEANRRLARARRPKATAEQPAGPRATSDQQLLAHLTLVVLMLGSHPTRYGTREAGRHVRPEVLESLHEAGLLDYDPARRAVRLTDAGVAHAQRLLQKLRTL